MAHWAYTEEQLDLRHGGTWVPSKRFGIRQSGKIRCIDDCSEFLVNSSTSVPEKLDLEALDQFVALAPILGGRDLRSCWRKG